MSLCWVWLESIARTEVTSQPHRAVGAAVNSYFPITGLYYGNSTCLWTSVVSLSLVCSGQTRRFLRSGFLLLNHCFLYQPALQCIHWTAHILYYLLILISSLTIVKIWSDIYQYLNWWVLIFIFAHWSWSKNAHRCLFPELGRCWDGNTKQSHPSFNRFVRVLNSWGFPQLNIICVTSSFAFTCRN